jgi:hypothetical protein
MGAPLECGILYDLPCLPWILLSMKACLECCLATDSIELPAGLVLSPGLPGPRGPVYHSCLVRTASGIPL